MSENHMNEKLFKQLLASVREGGAILRGEMLASRTFEVAVPKLPSSESR